MDHVRLGIIGMGNIGRHHAEYLLGGKVDRCQLVAVCSPVVAELERYPSLKRYTNGHELIRSGNVDAVIVATPHYQHMEYGIAAMRAGVHVMVEKPIAAHKADAERLVAIHAQHRHIVFAGMFQLRTEPRYLKIQQLINDGELGELIRINWINTDWYRTNAYYASSDWRGTWSGEGGGVLLNQCLHNLDTIQWLCGMPARLRGFCHLGRFHPIEVEDDVTVYMEWPGGGATGTFISSTGESPGTNRLEISGTRGRVLLENDRLTFTRNEQDTAMFTKTADRGFLKPLSKTIEIPFENAVLPHATMLQNFTNAILDDQPLLVPGEEGVHSVELANAMVYSSLMEQTIELPLDGSAWEHELNQLVAKSRRPKRAALLPAANVAADDFASSFRR